MVQIELTRNEAEMLREVLQKQLSELSFETAFTHRKDFHEFLRKRKEFMESFIQRLEKELGLGIRESGSTEQIRKGAIVRSER